jgi:transcriptional regulator with XRE-family HTH domain
VTEPVIVRDYQHLIASLDAYRRSQRDTKADVARRIPIDRASVSRWLSGQNEPYVDRLVELVQAAGYDLALVRRGEA